MLYPLLKWAHVMAAIIALGANMTYGFWLSRVPGDSRILLFTLRTVKFIDDRVANPAYGVSLITGIALVFVGRWPFTTPWIAAALGLYALVVVIGIVAYTPTVRRQIAAAESGGAESPEYQAMARRGAFIGIALSVIIVAIVYLMVVKPGLWR